MVTILSGRFTELARDFIRIKSKPADGLRPSSRGS
ncbi:uncharacterized protein FFMR_07374 [Fusarium fujikuroi]|nr:uncharacterized protein FFMR_07374 [Fusarium fujikuroi]